MNGIIVDTGFLVSLFLPADRLRNAAREFLRNNRRPLLTATPVVVETCFFLDANGKSRLLEWIQRGAIAVTEVPSSTYADIRGLIRRYADRDIDFADATLIWLAGTTACREILTVDVRDFSVFRIGRGKCFELLKWFER